MNSAAFRAFSSLAVPNYRGEAINTMAVNRWGDVFSLSQNGLNYISLLQKTTESNSLPLSGPDKQLLSQMSCLKFNSYGTMLLVWGANAAGIVVLPRTYTLYGEFEFDGSDKRKACEFIAVLRPEECRGQLMKVQWHPFHSEYVVMLHQKGPIEMKNIFTNSKISAFLSQSIQYSSFSFGPCIGWLAVSVLVLADNGYVYVICPMLPVGSLIPTEVVLQMAEGLAYENDVMKQPSSERGRLLRHANLYMSAAFGDLSGEYRAHGNWIRVGGPIASLRASAATAEPTELSYHQRLMLEVLNCPPALQGALHEISDANMPSNASSKRQNVGPGSSKSHTDWSNAGSSDKSSSRKRDSGTNELAATACDIVVLPAAPGERGSESDWSSSDCAPVVVMVRTDGSSKICVIKGQVNYMQLKDIYAAHSFFLNSYALTGMTSLRPRVFYYFKKQSVATGQVLAKMYCCNPCLIWW